MKDLREIEEYRVAKGPLGTVQENFPNGGMFMLPLTVRDMAVIICSDGKYEKEDTGFEHCAVHINYQSSSRKNKRKTRSPKVSELIKVRDVLWNSDDDVFVAFSDKAKLGDGWQDNLHLWRCKKKTLKNFPDSEDYEASIRYIKSASSSNSETPA